MENIFIHTIDDILERETETEREGMLYSSLLLIWCFVPFLKVYPVISRLHQYLFRIIFKAVLYSLRLYRNTYASFNTVGLKVILGWFNIVWFLEADHWTEKSQKFYVMCCRQVKAWTYTVRIVRHSRRLWVISFCFLWHMYSCFSEKNFLSEMIPCLLNMGI